MPRRAALAARLRARGEPGVWRSVTWVLLAVNALLLVGALRLGSAEVRDGAASVTTGWTIALGILGTVALAGAAGLLGTTPRLRAKARSLLLGAQALHAAGHLLGWYYRLRWYDDALHFALLLATGLLVFELVLASERDPRWASSAVKVFLLPVVVATAAAGAWEIFEFLADLASGTREQDDLADTMLDMIDGVVGGVVAGGIALARTFAPTRRRLD